MSALILRWAVAFVLLALTYNSTPWNYVTWAQANMAESLSLVVLGGLVLLIGYIIYLRATLRSIGAFGMLLILALVGALFCVAYDFGLLSHSSPTQMTWIAIVAMSLVLGVGLSWSHIRRQLSGQSDMDNISE